MGYRTFFARNWSVLFQCTLAFVQSAVLFFTSRYQCLESQTGFSTECQPNHLLHNFNCNATSFNVNLFSAEWTIQINCPWSNFVTWLVIMAILFNLCYVIIITVCFNTRRKRRPVWVLWVAIVTLAIEILSIVFQVSEYNLGTQGCQKYIDQFSQQVYKIECERDAYELLLLIEIYTLIPIGIGMYQFVIEEKKKKMKKIAVN